MVNPQPGERILDPAAGTGGFLTAYEHVRAQIETSEELDDLKSSVLGVEEKSLPHLLCVTNMMIHGVEVLTTIRHDNTLARPLRDYGPSDRVDIVITNPPFGGTEENGIENNFPAEFRTRETADLFLLLVMELLDDGGRAAVVLPDSTLFGDGIKARLKQRLVETCNLTRSSGSGKGFRPYTTINTNVLFFTKGEPTSEIWYYEHPYPDGYKSYSKTKPMRIEEFEAEKAWWSDRQETEQAWRVPIEDIVASGYDLDIANPHQAQEVREDLDVLRDRYQQASCEAERAQSTLLAALAEALDESATAWRRVQENWGAVVADEQGVEQA